MGSATSHGPLTILLRLVLTPIRPTVAEHLPSNPKSDRKQGWPPAVGYISWGIHAAGNVPYYSESAQMNGVVLCSGTGWPTTLGDGVQCDSMG